MTKSFLILLSILSIYSCNGKEPKGILSQNEMQSVFWDLIKADKLAQEVVRKDSTKKLSVENIKYINQVLAIHNLSKSELDKSLDYYHKRPDLLANIFDSIQLQESKRVTHTTDKQYSSP